ncbi:hypothetical protein QNI16_38450 [Cytophagaceae bacterium YF14B1]|uniref:Uncharacterized protein n=1 Tax=Xanthocytophaga flava TaxID=3048013 RepID=A0AAE3UC44_9BACT|nr:hypothetical protein [Xanthocytophaga flavus]MDJ1486422.1 hypothetical protein [Xanthocytophaga flavus]
MFEKTGQLLSTSTLKRIWGKIKYNSRPNINTLDALARFIDYPHWRAFENATLSDKVPVDGNAIEIKKTNSIYPIAAFYVLVALSSFVLLAFILYKKKQPPLKFENLVFKSKLVTQDLPNTVVFEYDASQSNADSIFIQQSWDRKLRQRVNKMGKVFTTTYYVPGYYKAKLIFNDSIVKEHEVFIETSGWKGILDLKPAPGYLNNEAIVKEDALGFTQQQIGSYYSADKEPALFVLANVNKSFTSIDSNQYELKMQLQNTYQKAGLDVCQKTFVSILGSSSFIMIPLSKKGCVGDVTLIMGDKKLSGKTNNLENFGVDFTKKVKLRCELDNKVFKIFIDDALAYTSPDPEIGKLVGVKVAFTGAGLISDFSLTNSCSN